MSVQVRCIRSHAEKKSDYEMTKNKKEPKCASLWCRNREGSFQYLVFGCEAFSRRWTLPFVCGKREAAAAEPEYRVFFQSRRGRWVQQCYVKNVVEPRWLEEKWMIRGRSNNTLTERGGWFSTFFLKRERKQNFPLKRIHAKRILNF